MGVTPMPRRGDELSSGGPVPPADLYRLAVEEYRFQATHNWSRTRDLLALNAAVLAAATAVAANTEGAVAALVFAFGAFAAVASMFVVHQQHDYYRAARNRMRRIEDALELTERTDTTSTLGERNRLLSVHQLVLALLAALVVADAVGLGLMLGR